MAELSSWIEHTLDPSYEFTEKGRANPENVQ